MLDALNSATGGCRRKAPLVAARACRAWASRAASAPRHARCRLRRVATPWACWCNATSASRRDLRIAGVPVGEEITDLQPCIANNEPLPANSARRNCDAPGGGDAANDIPEQGSIIVVVATDAPLMPHQLKRLVTRVSLGVGRQGGFGGNGSGDIFVAFSTANPKTLGVGQRGDAADAHEQPHLAALPGHGAGDRSGDHERVAGGRDHDRSQRLCASMPCPWIA